MNNNIKLRSLFLLILLTFVSALSYASGNQPKIVIKVEGACGMCETRIEEAAMNTKGVIEADWNIDDHNVNSNL